MDHRADLRSVQFRLVYGYSQRFSFSHENIYFSPPQGKELSSFCLLLNGDVTFTTEDGIVNGHAGDFFYMPDGISYHSHWTSETKVEYLSTFFRLGSESDQHRSPRKVDLNGMLQPIDRTIAFQNIRELGNYQMQDAMETLMGCDRHNPVELLTALSSLYGIFARAYPYLKTRPQRKYSDVLKPALLYLDHHYTLNEPIAVYAQMCHLSESRFYHLFREQTDKTPIEYKNALRIHKATMLLVESDQSIEQISGQLGFESAIYFRRVFKQTLDMTPSQFRKRMCATPMKGITILPGLYGK